MIEVDSSSKIVILEKGGIRITRLNIRGLKPMGNELLSLMDAKNIDIACIQETLISPSINVNFPSYSLERADRPPIKKGAKNGGWVAFLIRIGETYAFQSASFNPRDLTTEFSTITVYPFAESPFRCATSTDPQRQMKTTPLHVTSLRKPSALRSFRYQFPIALSWGALI